MFEYAQDLASWTVTMLKYVISHHAHISAHRMCINNVVWKSTKGL